MTVSTDDTRAALQRLHAELGEAVLGQARLTERMLIALLADGHLLVEGAPGLAKTRAIRALAAGVDASFHRVQFTPDLLPGDLTGTDIYHAQDGSFAFQPGPIFHHFVLADEINRAPAKVQSALLEAMAERQVTVGRQSHALPDPFLVMATQNPLEQEGTYPLPEAQLDRFLMQVRIDYPDADAERAILALARDEARSPARELMPMRLDRERLADARRAVLEVHLAPPLEEYLLQLVLATRDARRYGGPVAGWIRYGASPRATIALDRSSRARAWLLGRDHVLPEDILTLAPDILAHRLLLSYEAEAEGVTNERVVEELLARVPLP